MTSADFKKYWMAELCVLLLLAATAAHGGETLKPAQPVDPNAIKVLCAGDSITARGYPDVLQQLLGPGYAVRNAGHSGVTALKNVGTRSYPNAGAKEDSQIVVIMLGTNDSKVETWPKYKEQFAKDYKEVIESFKNLKSKPKVYVALSPPIYKKETGTGFSAKNQEEMVELTRVIAKDAGCETIDVHAITSNKPGAFGDGVHPNDEGKALIAKAIFDAITTKKEK